MTEARKEDLAKRFDTEEDKHRGIERIRVMPFAEMTTSIRNCKKAGAQVPHAPSQARYFAPGLCECV
jgi:hypothetical protein